MNASWSAIQERIDALSLRERALVLLTALAVMYVLWDLAVYRPVVQARATMQSELDAVDNKIAALSQEERILQQSLTADPDQALKHQIEQLRARMGTLDQELSQLSVGLVPADKLATILQEVLAQTNALELHSLQTLPVEPLQLQVKNVSPVDTAVKANNAGVYKHSVAITVRGSYFQLLDYLKSLEAMDWRFYWDELRYTQEDYPTGLFEIRVYTLSTSEGLFGV